MKYRVLNPRGIDKGVRILILMDTLECFEGDKIQPPADMPQKDVDDLVTKGFLEVVRG